MTDVSIDNIEVGTILVVGGKLAIVEEVKHTRPTNPISYRNNTTHRGYICGIGDVDAILGHVELGNWRDALKSSGNAVKLPSGIAHTSGMPDMLRGINVGDRIQMRHGRGGPISVEYAGYKASRPKYPILYKHNGRTWKGAVASLVAAGTSA